jgi:excisionase family DNA binding protein
MAGMLPRSPLFVGSVEIGTRQAARMLNTSVDTLMRLVESGEIQAYQLHEGGWWRVSYDSVIEYRNRISEKYALGQRSQKDGGKSRAAAKGGSL